MSVRTKTNFRQRMLALTLAAAVACGGAAFAGDANGLHYVLMSSGPNSNTISVNGSSDEFDRARQYRKGNEALLYVNDDGARYVIRDAGLLQKAEAIHEPQRRLGAQQGALGRQQGELGRRQGALGSQQGMLGAKMRDAKARGIGELGRQMSELGSQQAALGREQAALGARQAALGKQQAELSKAARADMRKLVDEAVQRGLAQRVN